MRRSKPCVTSEAWTRAGQTWHTCVVHVTRPTGWDDPGTRHGPTCLRASHARWWPLWYPQSDPRRSQGAMRSSSSPCANH
jgi:hypothetical protein